MDYVQILPRLTLGSHPQTTDDIEKLRRESGVTAVLNLQTDDDMRAVNVVWEPLEAHYQVSGILLRRFRCAISIPSISRISCLSVSAPWTNCLRRARRYISIAQRAPGARRPWPLLTCTGVAVGIWTKRRLTSKNVANVFPG